MFRGQVNFTLECDLFEIWLFHLWAPQFWRRSFDGASKMLLLVIIIIIQHIVIDIGHDTAVVVITILIITNLIRIIHNIIFFVLCSTSWVSLQFPLSFFFF